METASGHFMRQTIQAEYTNTPTVRETLRTLIRTKICTNGFGRQNVTDKQKKKKKQLQQRINRINTWSTDQCNSTINVKMITNKQQQKGS